MISLLTIMRSFGCTFASLTHFRSVAIVVSPNVIEVQYEQPVEGLWTQVKDATASDAPRHIQELHRKVYIVLKHLANSQRWLRAWFRIAMLPLPA